MDLAAAINAASARDARTALLRAGTVASFATNRITLNLGGTTIAAVPYLATYAPTIGDVVQVLQTGTQVLVLGKTA